MNDPLNVGEGSRLYRLLYRGSLSLPDSEIVLDGITFIAKIPSHSPSRLLDCPIALALESMRGRPSLRFISVVKTYDISHECLKDVYMYIHPRSIIARRFFENILCTEEVNENSLTHFAVRLGFGDGHGADDSDILVFGRLSPFQSSLELSVGRINTPEETSTGKRKPRPDDPVPRNPLFFVPTKKQSLGKKRTSQLSNNDKYPERLKVDKVHGKQKTASDNESHPTSQAEAASHNRSQLRHKRSSGGVPSASVKDPCLDKPTPIWETADMETANKAVVKRLAVDKLLRCGVTKDHPEFRDLFNHIVHSIGFALRQNFKAMQINLEDAERLVDLHVRMYLGEKRNS